MSSLGANVTIPDQVVLVGGTGRHLSDRFGSYGGFAAPRDTGVSTGIRNDPGEGLFSRMRSEGMYQNGYGMAKNNAVQERLGPRRFTGNDMNQSDLQDDLWDALPSPAANRPHVLKRLGQQNYNPWSYANAGAGYSQHDDRSGYGQKSGGYGTSYTAGQVGRGAGRPRRARGYYNSYGGYRYNRYSYSPYSYYNSYSSPYSYYNYSRPRFGNYTKYYGTAYTPFRNYSTSYNNRGRYYGSSYNRARRGGRYNRNSSRSHITQEELDRDLDDYRAAGETKKERNGDVHMT